MAWSVLEKFLHDLHTIHIAKLQHSLAFAMLAVDTMISHNLFISLSLRLYNLLCPFKSPITITSSSVLILSLSCCIIW